MISPFLYKRHSSCDKRTIHKSGTIPIACITTQEISAHSPSQYAIIWQIWHLTNSLVEWIENFNYFRVEIKSWSCQDCSYNEVCQWVVLYQWSKYYLVRIMISKGRKFSWTEALCSMSCVFLVAKATQALSESVSQSHILCPIPSANRNP